MRIVRIPATMIDGAYRRQGWRATLRNEGVTVWRCTCDRPHLTKSGADSCGLSALRARLGRQGMRIWSASFRPREQFTQAEIECMDEERSLTLLEIQTHPNLPSWENPEAFPAAAHEARAAIVRYERIMLEDENWTRVRQTKRLLENIIEFFKEHTEIRQQAEISLLCGEKRIAGEFVKAQKAGLIGVEGRPPKNLGVAPKFSIPEVFGKGGHSYVKRLRIIDPIAYEQIRQRGRELHLAGKDATLHALSELINAEETKARRKASLYAEPLPDGMEYRIGDCREVLNDIEDNSVAAVITDPPYETGAEPLYDWLAGFAARALVPGGSLICYTGQGRLNRTFRIFDQYLTYWWEGVLLHAHAQKMLWAGVRANFKPILWYVKGDRGRRVVHVRKTLVPDVLNDRRPTGTEDEFLEQIDCGRALSTRDKSDHNWAQGDAGVRVWIHHLTRQQDDGNPIAELIVDPFAGPGTWGRIAANMGRRWIGCDIEAGGTESVRAEDLGQAAD